MNIAIIYHSESGNTEEVAEIIKDGAESLENVKAQTMHIDNVDIDFVNSADAVIFGTPTYTGNLSWQMKDFLGNYPSEINLSGKLGSTFATQRYVGGGAGVALQSILAHLLVKGMVVYTVGGGEGKPFTHYGAVCIQNGNEEQRERARIFGKRIAKKALELFA